MGRLMVRKRNCEILKEIVKLMILFTDTIVLANYAEYFILATFFWLLVNCMNNCIHAW